MCLAKWLRRRKKRRRERIYEGPCMDGGTRISNDTDAPKEISSRELVSFSCRFSFLSLTDFPLKQGVHFFTAGRDDDGKGCTAAYNCSTAPGEGQSRVCKAEFLGSIDALLRKYNVAQHNGRYYKVSGLPNFYGASVDAVYASGETIYCYNNQDPFLPIGLIQELYSLFVGTSDNSP